MSVINFGEFSRLIEYSGNVFIIQIINGKNYIVALTKQYVRIFYTDNNKFCYYDACIDEINEKDRSWINIHTYNEKVPDLFADITSEKYNVVEKYFKMLYEYQEISAKGFVFYFQKLSLKKKIKKYAKTYFNINRINFDMI